MVTHCMITRNPQPPPTFQLALRPHGIRPSQRPSDPALCYWNCSKLACCYNSVQPGVPTLRLPIKPIKQATEASSTGGIATKFFFFSLSDPVCMESRFRSCGFSVSCGLRAILRNGILSFLFLRTVLSQGVQSRWKNDRGMFSL